MDSDWCRHEVESARDRAIPIIPIIDVDKQPARQVVDGYIQRGFGWLFDEQACATMIPYILFTAVHCLPSMQCM